MLYYLVRPLARYSLRHYYQHIDLIGREHIPPLGKAVILAANHPTTFLEPCILACFLDRPLNFLVRGDMFRQPFYARILRALHMLPVYRMRDGGYQNIKQNYATFEACFRALADYKTLMVLAEGRCIHEKRLRPLRKGTARVALGALDQPGGPEEVYIVPVGVNFTHAEQARSTVMIEFGKPMLVSQYLSQYEDNATAAINQLTDDLAERLRALVYHIERPADDALVENLLTLQRSQHPRPSLPVVSDHAQQLHRERQLIDAVNALPDASRPPLRGESYAYFNRLAQLRLTDAALAGNYRPERTRTNYWLARLLPATLLLAWHLTPLGLAEWLASTKIKEQEFYLPVRWAATTGFYLLWLLLWVLVAALLGSITWLVYGLLALGLVGWVVRSYEGAYRALLAWRWRHQISPERERLLTQREALLQQLPHPPTEHSVARS